MAAVGFTGTRRGMTDARKQGKVVTIIYPDGAFARESQDTTTKDGRHA